MSLKTKLIKSEEVAQDTMAFYFEKPEGFSYRAGQYAYFPFPKKRFWEKSLSHHFSFITAPHEEVIGFATRMRESQYKNRLKYLPLGSEIGIDGPYGEFVLPKDLVEAPFVFLAGGIGMTPVYSMIKEAIFENFPGTIYFFYSNKRPETSAFLDELVSLAENHSKIQFIPTMTGMEASDNDWNGEKGYVTPGMIEKYVPDPKIARYYISGPFDMVKSMKDMVKSMDIPSAMVMLETFTGY